MDEFRDGLEGMLSAMHGKASGEVMDKLLSGRADLAKQFRDFEYRPGRSYIHDIPILQATLGRFADMTTAINRYQEGYFRRAIFDGTLRTGLRDAGIDYAKFLENPAIMADAPRNALYDRAARDALDLTFANQNVAGWGRQISAVQSLRPFTTFFAAFPRYMANAATYVARRNPMGLVRMAFAANQSPQARAQIAAEAATGTMLLAGAVAARLKWGGEKWYEFGTNKEDKSPRVDVRGFAGPLAPMFFMGDVVAQMLTHGALHYTVEDYADGLAGMSRISGQMRSLINFFDKAPDDPTTWNQYGGAIVGDWLSGFATQADQIKDAMVLLGDEEAGKLRDTRERPILGPTMAKIPGLSSTLPERTNLTTGEPLKVDMPIFSKTIGLGVQLRNPVEGEMNRLGLQAKDVAPKTGIPKADRALYRRVGKLVAVIGPKVIATPEYQGATDVEKELALHEIFKTARGLATKHLKATNPQLAHVIDAHRKLGGETKKLLAERGVDVDAALQKIVDGIPEE